MSILLNTIRVLALVLIFTFISAKGPEIHSAYIRSYVGDRTVLVSGARGGGSGFFVKAASGKTFIMTNQHVCELADSNGMLNIQLENTKRVFNRRIVEKYENHDLCLIEGIGDTDGLKLASSLDIGETIGLIGHPKLQPLTLNKGEYIGDKFIKIVVAINIEKDQCPGEYKKYKNSVVSNLFGVDSICIRKYYSSQITAYSRGGSSGSPVVNFFGNVVGVLFAGNRMDQFETFMVPLTDIQEFLKKY
jgi:S1-C subfamily serine protease